uniref:T-cell receptor alpha/delta variable 31.0 n=1 Tax=Sinocyclocheilus rhinocerous TaxID=307959 RepID=A0A673I943_9TELE
DDTVDQPHKHVIKFEGESVTLDCKYTTASTSQELFWYIQRTEESPKLVLQRNSYGGGSNGTEFQERFYSEVKPSKSVPLIIQRLCVSDSAVYYCALRSKTNFNPRK